MNKRLEFVQKKFNVKSEKELTESQLIEYAKSQEAGIGTNIAINNVLNASKDTDAPSMKKVYECLRQAIRRDLNFRFGMNSHENPEPWWYDVR